MQVIGAGVLFALGGGRSLEMLMLVGFSSLLPAPWWFIGHAIGVAWEGPPHRV